MEMPRRIGAANGITETNGGDGIGFPPGKNKSGSRGTGAAWGVLRVIKPFDYWFGRMNSVKPMVLTARNIGVRGGKSSGFRKSVSKL
jgi:hypothetical protein